MKRFAQCVSLVLILAICLAIPAYAVEETSPWASSYFASRSAYLWKISGSQFQVWFDVGAVGGMAELGASKIKVQRSSDNSNWTTMQTYIKEDYSSMIGYNTGDHNSYVTYYTGESGYYYRAYVEFYAKNSSGGCGYYDYYTASIKL